MGYDPFAAATGYAPPLLRVRVERAGSGFVAWFQLVDPSGKVLWSRPPLADPDCGHLVHVIGEVTIPVAIDVAASSAAPIALPARADVSPTASAFPAARRRASIALAPSPARAAARSSGLGARGAVAIGVGPMR